MNDNIDFKTVKTAVDSLLQSHAETGSDLTCWPGVLPLVAAVYPDIRIEGTGPAGDHTLRVPVGETGRYWINGEQNTNAYVDSGTRWANETKERLMALQHQDNQECWCGTDHTWLDDKEDAVQK
jgi:hypothetical protein